MTQFADDAIIVTGAAGGIGQAIAGHLIQCGAVVALFDRNADALEQVTSQLASDRAHAFVVDITSYQDVSAAVAAFEADAGPVYGLVNNAGWDEAHPFLETTPDFWTRVIDINLMGALNLTHVAGKRMAALGRGSVVTIASDAGRVGSSGEAVYSAAKGGLIAFMKTMARELATKGINCNSVCPGPTDTPLLAALDVSGKLAAALERAVPMKRLARPADFPPLVALLLSPESSYLTGQTISVSGGLSMNG